MAIEYVDRASMDQPIDVSLRDKTIRGHLIPFCPMATVTGGGYEMESSKSRIGMLQNTPKTFCTELFQFSRFQKEAASK